MVIFYVVGFFFTMMVHDVVRDGQPKKMLIDVDNEIREVIVIKQVDIPKERRPRRHGELYKDKFGDWQIYTEKKGNR